MTGEFSMPERPVRPSNPNIPDTPKTTPNGFAGKIIGVLTSTIAILGASFLGSSFSAVCKDGTYQFASLNGHSSPEFAACGLPNFPGHGGMDHYTYKLFSLDPKLYWFRVETSIMALVAFSVLVFLGKRIFNFYVSKKAAASGESFEQTRNEVIAKAVAKQEQLLPTGATTVPGSFIKKLALFVVVPFVLLITLLTLLAGAHH